MKTEATASLIESYLLNTKKYIKPYGVSIKQVKSTHTPHHLVKFTCLGAQYEIKVFAPDFMIFKVAGLPGKVCDSLIEAKNQIDFLLDSSLSHDSINSEF